MDKNTINVNFGGFVIPLTITFIVLKLCGVITWSWLWVFSPLWIFFLLFIAFIMLCLAIIGAILLLAWLVEYYDN